MSGQPAKGHVNVANFHGSSDIECDGGEPVAIGLEPGNARRMAACWNHCIDIDTETMEQGRPMLERVGLYLARERELESARDAAFALLRELLDKGVHDLAEPDAPNGMQSTGELEELQARVRSLLGDAP